MDDFRRPPPRKFGLLTYGQEPGLDAPLKRQAMLPTDGAGTGFGSRPRHVTPVMWKPNDDKWGPPNPEKPGLAYRLKEAGMRANGNLQRNMRTIIASMGAGQFSKQDVAHITREILDNISLFDSARFEEVSPAKDGRVRLDDAQWKIVAKMIDGFPEDELGTRTRAAYQRAIQDGRLLLLPKRSSRKALAR